MVATGLVHEFICRFGCPEIIKTDQGSNFQSRLMEHVARLFKIRQMRSTYFHPATMGSLEHSHHTLVEYLKMYITRADWDLRLQCSMFSYNTSVHSPHLYTLYELIFGRKARLPSEFERQVVDKTFSDSVDDLIAKLNTTQSESRERYIQAKEKSKRYYEQKLKLTNFSVGDDVFLLKETRVGKLDDQYAGRYKILEFIGERNARISLGD